MTSNHSRLAIIVISLYSLALTKSVLFSFFGFGLLDEGEMLHNASRILLGALPYRDFFSVFPPFHNYFYAVVFWLFGPSIVAPRIVASVIFSFTPVLVFLLTRLLARTRYALIPSLLLIFLGENVDRLYKLTPLLGGLYLYLYAKHSSSIRTAFLSGLVLGVAALFRLDFAAAVVVSIAFSTLFLSKTTKKVFFWHCVGFASVLGLFVVWLTSHGLWDYFVANALIAPVAITQVHDLPFPTLTTLFTQGISLASLAEAHTAAIGYTILLIYLGALFLFIRHRVFLVCLFIIWGILQLPYLFGRSDLGHLIKGGLPALLLLPLILSSLPKFGRRLALLLVAGIFIGGVGESIWLLNFFTTKTTIGNDTIMINRDYIARTTVPSAQTLSEAATFLRESPGPVLALPYMAGLYYLSGTTAPTRFDNVLSGYLDNTRSEGAFTAALENRRVARVVYDPNQGPRMQVNTFPDYNPLVHNYLMSNFTIVHTTPEGWLFMEKKND